jgi:AraC family transcriptional regulator of adaptative response/methylated-DNA-[protein]-cysteine methyltransferase
MHTSIAEDSTDLPDFSTDLARDRALRRRDPRAEGQFYYAVITTGVYCRPTCAARPPRPENVRFHRTPEEAERAGFRPCKRCRPRDPSQAERHARIVADARRQLEESETPPALEALARGAGLSTFYLHRLFRRHTGLTPREYAAAHRLHRAKDELRRGASVTAALHEAGYSSSGRFYEEATGALGMPPAQVRRGGAGETIHALCRPSSLGLTLVATTARGVCAIAFGEAEGPLLADLRRRFPRAAVLAGGDPALVERVVAMIDGGEVAADLPLDLVGTAFQRRVWRALREVPRGGTVSYGELAARIGAPRAVRAVGMACGANPVAVAVPCHRVVRGDGSIGGYRWGLARKKTLLARERAAQEQPDRQRKA